MKFVYKNVLKCTYYAHFCIQFVYGMKIEIPTSPEIGEQIKLLFADRILKPVNMELVRIEPISEVAVLVSIDCRALELRDVFFLGYRTSYVGQLKK